MKERKLKKYLRESLKETDAPLRLEETVSLCREAVRDLPAAQWEERTGFFAFLSDVFRYEGAGILGLQALALLIVCLGITNLSHTPEGLPLFVPLFSLAAIPVLLRGQMHGMCEMEAATRASGAQLILARLLLSGAVNLVYLTVLLCLAARQRDAAGELGQMILYVLVPYLSCMVFILRRIRLCQRENVFACTAYGLLACAFWGVSARFFPGLYEVSAGGVWAAAFLAFGGFFVREIGYIWEMRKEGKMYGTVA